MVGILKRFFFWRDEGVGESWRAPGSWRCCLYVVQFELGVRFEEQAGVLSVVEEDPDPRRHGSRAVSQSVGQSGSQSGRQEGRQVERL
jgi:hypothetical protein